MKSQFPNSAIRMEFSNSKPEDFSPEVRAWRAYAVEEIKKVMSKRAYLEQAKRRRELEELWVSTPEYRSSASYGRNWGYYVGLDNIRAYYVDKNPFGGVGTDICHPFTTYKIIVADDNKTAQVTWYSIGYEINPANGPETDCYWDNQRCGADLVYEDGQWKIWHRSLGSPQRSLKLTAPSITISSILRSPWSTPPSPTPSATAPKAIPTGRRRFEHEKQYGF